FGLLRYREALGVATRALRRRREQDDLAARLRVVRGQGLWLTGPARLAQGELRKAARQATKPLTRGRVLEGQAVFAWKAHDLDGALAHLVEAEEIYARAAWPAGTARVLEKRAAVLRSAGRLQEALRLLESRIEVTASLGRPDALALARSDRGALLVVLGRWEEARRDFDEAAALFHARDDAREVTVAAAGRAMVDLATGDLS